MSETGTSRPDFDAMSDEEVARWVGDNGTEGVAWTTKIDKRHSAFIRKQADHMRASMLYVPERHPHRYRLGISGEGGIYIPPGRRPLNEDTVAQLMVSIERVGLQSPPAVRMVDKILIDGVEEHSVAVLVYGHHRLEAMRRLGWQWTTCLVLDLDDIAAELAEISENLHRAELTLLQRDEQIARWIELTTVKPEISSDDAKPAQVAQVSGGRGNKGGISEASRELGIERTDATRALRVAALSPEAKAAAKESGLDDNRSALLEAAKQTAPEKQVAVIRTRSQARRATKGEREAIRESMKAALEIARREAEERKAKPEPPDESDDDVDDDGYYLENEPVDQWRRSVMNMAGDHISMPAFWTREFGDWASFAATTEMVQLALDAALMWSNLAVDLKQRLRDEDHQQGA